MSPRKTVVFTVSMLVVFRSNLIAAHGDALEASEGSEGGRADDGRVFNGCRSPRTRLRRWSGCADC